MADGLLDKLLGSVAEDKVYGVAPGTVLDNIDPTGDARVQVQLPWYPGFEPWARVAVPIAGNGRGAYAIPQVGDEVLLAFEQGDITAPYVVGSLWNGNDRPPAASPMDSVSKIVLHTPAGHVIELDDLQQSITVTTVTKQTVTIDAQKIELKAGGSKATLATSGKISLEASTEIELKATSIKLQGTTIDISATGSLALSGSGDCSVKGAIVRIN
jgi:uncharacterized protein involved in type VI secretion and phage assembly